MWNRKHRILWLRLQTADNKFFRFSFPIPLYVFWELLDSTLDLSAFVCLFVPDTAHLNTPIPSIYVIKELLQMVMDLLDSLTDDEPYDFIDVTADKIKVSLKIR